MSKILLLAVLIMVVLCAFLFLPKKARGPIKDIPTQSQPEKNTNNSQIKVEKKVIDLKFPGVMPAEKIENKRAIIKTNKGTIELDLYGDKAPKSVSNFIYLVENKFYDGLTFHRVVPGFVIQGGDPDGSGSGGPGYKWDDEPVQGEYKEGALAMANSGPNTNGSQFFICLADHPSLPKLYNLFGQVISGMEVVEKIEIGDTIDLITIEDK